MEYIERWWWWSTELLSKSIAYGLNMTKPWCTKCKHLQKIKHFICLKHEIMKNEYIQATLYPSHQHVWTTMVIVPSQQVHMHKWKQGTAHSLRNYTVPKVSDRLPADILQVTIIFQQWADPYLECIVPGALCFI